MSVWANWQADLLTHAGVPDTAANRRFLTDWHSHAETNCRNNPVDLSVPSAGASNCRSLPGITEKAQNYATTGDAVHAFYLQVRGSFAQNIRRALESGDPYTVSYTGKVAEDLTAWGSQTFAHWYFNATVNAPGRGGGIQDGDALRGWADLQRSINRNMPKALHDSANLTRHALRALSRGRKVHI